jgi:hypothetical protein
MALKPITKKELQELKSIVDKQILDQELNRFVEGIRSCVIQQAQNSTKTSYKYHPLYYSRPVDSIYIENIDDIKSRLTICFPDSKVELVYQYELLDGRQISSIENEIEEPYAYKWVYFNIDWS